MATTTAPPPPEKQPHRAGRPQLQGQQDHALRRLRPQRHLRAHRRSLLRDGRASPNGRQVQRHRLLLEDRPPTSWAARTASTPSTAACPPSPPAPCWPTATCWRIGVTGDGDTASIGIGQFIHLVRRNLPMIYIIEDNGVYGLTKGQFSATADLGSQAQDRRHQRSSADRLPARWPSHWAPPSSPAPSPATRSSCRPS